VSIGGGGDDSRTNRALRQRRDATTSVFKFDFELDDADVEQAHGTSEEGEETHIGIADAATAPFAEITINWFALDFFRGIGGRNGRSRVPGLGR
jgi:hypothetical protein